MSIQPRSDEPSAPLEPNPDVSAVPPSSALELSPEPPPPSLWQATWQSVGRIVAGTVLCIFLMGANWVIWEIARVLGWQNAWWVAVLDQSLTICAVVEMVAMAAAETFAVLARSWRAVLREARKREP